MKFEVGMAVIWSRKIPTGTLRIRCRVARLMAASAIVCPDVEDWKSQPKSLFRIVARKNLFPVQVLTENAV